MALSPAAEPDELLETTAPDTTVGVSRDVQGADSVFADVVVKLAGRLEVVLPSAGLRKTKVKQDHVAQFERLLGSAPVVTTMPFQVADTDAHVAANERVIGSINQVPSKKHGNAACTCP
jgi:hypothetical protein